MRKLLISTLVAGGSLLGTVVPVAAATVESLIEKYLPPFSSSGMCAAGTGDLPDVSGIFCVLVKIITILLTSAGGVAFLLLVIGGLRYMISGGDEKAITAAKSGITYSVLGLIIIFGAVLLINQVLSILLK